MQSAEPAQAAQPLQVAQIAVGIWQLTHQLAPEVPVHVHLVEGDYAALIDTGVASTFPLIESAFLAAGSGHKPVRVVLNTHGHHDHMGSNRRVRDVTGALVAAPAGAVPWIEDRERHLREFLFHHPEIIADTPELRAEIGDTMDGPSPVDMAIGDGFTLNLGRGVTLEAIALPGHVPAELGYYERRSGTLILGDAVTRADAGMPFFQGHMLPAAYRATLARLRGLVRSLPVRQVAPAHYPVMTAVAFMALLDRTELHLDEVDALVAAQVRDAERPIGLRAVWRGVCRAAGKQPEFRSLAMVEAHLLELLARGQVARTGPDHYAWISA